MDPLTHLCVGNTEEEKVVPALGDRRFVDQLVRQMDIDNEVRAAAEASQRTLEYNPAQAKDAALLASDQTKLQRKMSKENAVEAVPRQVTREHREPGEAHPVGMLGRLFRSFFKLP
ncbi:hypothetical protein [Pseudonocardia charpentierae]|uniref:Uncharacterized protein n=1 Tax=Pseudonocardia charpentierae TaxID=3075545 RepID=A0ABU2NK52_9PSEU|nr:hypothetical protein [Pseudonocardia sp. DSM 45834]MDT0353967.1 hypothetical protein [Pseudonocardia sp. DSM 45834]